MRWSGRLERRDLEGGVWMLHTREGVLTVYGDIPHDLAGAEVDVEGESAEGFGLAMTGPAIEARRVRRR
jgi:hypothetical protein